MSEQRTHPALSSSSDGLVCMTRACGTLLPADAEVCDECGGTVLEPLRVIPALLCGWAGERPVVFRLDSVRTLVIGRGSGDNSLADIDLARFPGSNAVHRRHVSVAPNGPTWRVTQLGTNPTVVRGVKPFNMAPGASAEITHGDTLEIAGIRLTLVVRREPSRLT
jgi:hypothetical protein